MKGLSAAVVAIAAGLLFSAPASAQSDGEKINQLIVFGNDPCPPSSGGEITVCARKDEAERYRIPQALRATTSSADEAWNNKVLAYETVSATGTQSCSPVGAGGWTGCANKLIDQAYAEKRHSQDVRFSELIQAEREKRLSTIDAEAAATQKRVEQAEREYDAKKQAEADAKEATNAPKP